MLTIIAAARYNPNIPATNKDHPAIWEKVSLCSFQRPIFSITIKGKAKSNAKTINAKNSGDLKNAGVHKITTNQVLTPNHRCRKFLLLFLMKVPKIISSPPTSMKNELKYKNVFPPVDYHPLNPISLQ